MSVDLLGDEKPGNDLVDATVAEPQPAESTPEDSRTAKTIIVSESESALEAKSKDLFPPNVAPPPVKVEAPSIKSESNLVPIPVVPVQQVSTKKDSRKKSSKRRKKSKGEGSKTESQKPIFADTYSDLDSILEGAGDASPVAPRPLKDVSVREPASVGSEVDGDQSGARPPSSAGMLAAFVSSILAFWFGVFSVVARFGPVEQPLVSGFTSTLHSIYSGDFGDYEVGSTLQILMIGLGWLFWIVALLLMVFGAAQFLNAMYRLIAGKHFFGSSDGLTGAMAVGALFIVVGLLFTQVACHQAQHKFLDDYEKPVVEQGQHLETIEALRLELTAKQTASRNWLIVGAVVPVSVFVFSTIRLFTDD